MPKNVLVFHILRIWKKKIQKKKNVATWGHCVLMWLRFLFFDFFPHKSVKCKKLAHFWQMCPSDVKIDGRTT